MDQHDPYYDPYADVDSDQEAARAEAAEADKEFELPDNIPEAPAVEKVNNIPVSEIYQFLGVLQNQLADSSRVEGVREGLKNSPEIAVALFQVLHESGLAKLVGEDTEEEEMNAALGIETEEVMFELPTTEAPPLPPGATTWLGKPRQKQGH